MNLLCMEKPLCASVETGLSVLGKRCLGAVENKASNDFT